MKAPVLLLALSLPTAATAGVDTAADPDTGLRRWRLDQPPFQLELVQRLPDQTRAFFLARGFPAGVADRIATACVFQTIVRNTGTPGDSPAVTVRLGEWTVYGDGRPRPPRLKEQWLEEWGTALATAPRLAFRWATFPTVQTFEPRGDYNWGMISFGLPPGTRFDLDVVWHEDGSTRNARIEGIRCPEDLHP